MGESLKNGTEFRRARLFLEGLLHDRFLFKSQFDFAGGEVAIKDLYVGVKDLPVVGKGLIGQYKMPFSLEELTSSKYITFMERGLPNVFAVGRQDGYGVWSNALDKRVTWAVSGFVVSDDDTGTSLGSGELGAALRVTGLPWYEDKGKRLVHLGVSYSYQNQPEDEVRFRQRPEAHLS